MELNTITQTSEASILERMCKSDKKCNSIKCPLNKFCALYQNKYGEYINPQFFYINGNHIGCPNFISLHN